MNDVAFSMRLVNTGIELRNYPYFASGLVAHRSDVASVMRLATWAQDCVYMQSSYITLTNDVAYVGVRSCCPQERCSISDAFSDVGTRLLLVNIG